MEENENPTTEPEKIKIGDRIENWLNMSQGKLGPTTIKRYRQAMNTYFIYYPHAKNILNKRVLTEDDLIDLVNSLTRWIFQEHKVTPYFYAYAMFSFMTYYFGKATTATFKEKMNFVQKTSERSNRILRDVTKIVKIIDILDEPYDIAARLEWETACRVGAVMKLQFAINLSEPQNMNVYKAIKEGILSFESFNSSQDDFWKDINGYYFVKLKEKRGHVLERVITEELFKWLLEWKDQRLFRIRQILERHYNEKEKVKYKEDLNTRMFPCSLNTYNKKLHEAAYKVGVQKFSSHWFRGTKITYLLQKGVTMRKIQMLVGHKNITTTERYAQPDINSSEELDKYLQITNDSLKMEK